jgi:hypothetical protein
MTTPKPATLLVQTAAGTSRYKVLETRRLQDGIATLTIQAGDWLDMGTYHATYIVGETKVKGTFAALFCDSSVGAIKFRGTFTREGVTWQS